MTVNAAMSTPVVAVGLNPRVQDAARLTLQYKIGGLPVIDCGKSAGIVTTIDILRAFLEIIEYFERIRIARKSFKPSPM